MTQRGHTHVHDAIHAGLDGRWRTAAIALRRLPQIVRNVPALLRAWQRRCDEQAFLASLGEYELNQLGLARGRRDDATGTPFWQA